MQTFAFNPGHQNVDVYSLEGYSRYRDPLNILVHETEAQYESAKNNDPDYWSNHTKADDKELEITGKHEANLRSTYQYNESIKRLFTNGTGFTT